MDQQQQYFADMYNVACMNALTHGQKEGQKHAKHSASGAYFLGSKGYMTILCHLS